MDRAIEPLDMKSETLEAFVHDVMDKALHAATTGSLARFSVGLLGAESLNIHRMGAAMADAYGLQAKHSTKQLDRFLTESSLNVHMAQKKLAHHLLQNHDEALIAIDWTDYDADDQTTLCAYLLTTHGRALPLLWETHKKSALKGNRTAMELAFVERLNDVIHEEMKVVVVADRGFGYQQLVQKLHELGLDFVLRIRKSTWIQDVHGTKKYAGDWIAASGRALMLRDVRVTEDETEVGAFIAVKAKSMKEGWCLISSLTTLNAPSIVKLYGKRFSIEETFRDTKNDRFGLGLHATHIGSPGRRDRLLFVCALAYVFIVTLGQAGEAAGVDDFLKVNTSKTRQLSLFNQGLRWLGLLPRLRESVKTPLLEMFRNLLNQNDFSLLIIQHIVKDEK